MIKHRFFLLHTLGWLLLLSGLFVWAGLQTSAAEDSLLRSRRSLVKALELTDFALWSEARYTRHPSQADLFTPFQEFPSAPEHFPAGSLLAPPASLPDSRIEFRPAAQNRP